MDNLNCTLSGHSFPPNWKFDRYECNIEKATGGAAHKDVRIEVRICQTCGYEEQRIAKISTDPASAALRGDEDGCSYDRDCKKCGREIKVKIGSHIFGDPYYIPYFFGSENKCLLTRKCSRCGYETRTNDFYEHEYPAWRIERTWKRANSSAVCILEAAECRNCGYKITRDTHEYDFDHWLGTETPVMDSEVDTIQTWTEIHVCKHCGDELVQDANDW